MTAQRPGRKAPKNYTDRFTSTESAGLHIEMQAIGTVHSPYRERYAAPRQPALETAEPATIELCPGMNLEQALADLEGFSHIWVIYWMHLNRGWNPTVVPPRGPKVRRGLFSTRAPHRPNSIGLSAVRLTSIEGRRLHIEDHDMLDGTPILDIKPYIPYTDAHPEASSGWLVDAGLAEVKTARESEEQNR